MPTALTELGSFVLRMGLLQLPHPKERSRDPYISHFFIWKVMQMFQTAMYYSDKMNRTDFKVKTFFNVFALETGQIKLKEMDLTVGFVCKLQEGVKVF